MEQPASEHLLKFGIDETTLRIVLHRFMSAGFMSDKENKQVLVSDLKDFATLLHTPGLDDAARRNALEAMLPQTELRPVNVLKLNNALNGRCCWTYTSAAPHA